MCSDVRQEFILLSDVLGVSMLVDAINHRQPEGATETTVLGPFHVVGAPQPPHGADIRPVYLARDSWSKALWCRHQAILCLVLSWKSGRPIRIVFMVCNAPTLAGPRSAQRSTRIGRAGLTSGLLCRPTVPSRTMARWAPYWPPRAAIHTGRRTCTS